MRYGILFIYHNLAPIPILTLGHILEVWHCTLLVPQLLVNAERVGHQVKVGPPLRHLAILQHQDLIRVHHCGKSMCNDDGGPPFGHSPESLEDVLQDMGTMNETV